MKFFNDGTAENKAFVKFFVVERPYDIETILSLILKYVIHHKLFKLKLHLCKYFL